MSKRRDQLQIMVDLLKIIRSCEIRTQIMVQMSMSWVQLMIYLDKLLEFKLIRISTENNVYITNKGRLMIKIVGDKV